MKRSIALVTIFAVIAVAYFQSANDAQSAGYTWSQTTWAGGETATAWSHAEEQASPGSWTKYTNSPAKDSGISAGTALTLSTTPGSVVQTNDGSTNTGFNLSGNDKDSGKITVSGSGDSASVSLSIRDISEIGTGVWHTAVIKADGTLWAWGLNSSGQLGLGDTTQRTSPVQVGSATWQTISAGLSHTLAIKTDGTLWSWGGNSSGQLGLGDTTQRTSPVQVGSDTWQAISTTESHSIAIKTDGTLWSWGYNGYGQLGLGDTTQRTSPVQVGSDTWQVISAGSYHTLAIKTDDTLWSWGQNASGQLGLGDTTQRTSPVQVGSTTWQVISAGGYHSLAIDTNDNLWSWGVNLNGQLGLGDTAQRTSPVQVGSATWQAVSIGGYYTLAIKTDDTLWSWGYNGYGQLGLGDTAQRTSPVQVGSATWQVISAGFHHAISFKNDNTLWAWGYNNYGQLGLGDTTQRTSPVQVDSISYLSGTFTSGVIDTGQPNASWGNLSWTKTGTGTVAMKARTCDDSACSVVGDINESSTKTWGSCTALSSGADLNTDATCVTDGDQYVQYQAALSTTDTTVTPSLDDVTIGYNYYPTNQSIVSSAYDSSDATNALGGLSWTEDASLPSGTTATVSLRTAAIQGGLTGSWTNFTNATSGCSKVGGVVTCSSDAIPAAMKDRADDRWLQYKIALDSMGGNTPNVYDITMNYVANGPPEVQSVTASQGSDGIVTVDYQVRDTDTTSNEVDITLQYCTANCATTPTWTDATAVAGDVGTGEGVTATYAAKQITWTAATNYDNQYNATNFKVRIKADDSESVNNLGYGISAVFTIDTTDPVPGSPAVIVNNNTNIVTLSATDNSSLQMKVGLVANLSDAAWETYSTTKSGLVLTADPETVYAQFKDAYGNVSSPISSATTPETPSAMMIQDTSNLNTTPDEYRLFLAWGEIAAPAPGFDQYIVYRSTDDVTYAQLDTVDDIAINYYEDGSASYNTLYYYKVASQDLNGNISNLSTAVNGKANGKQDAGEGGGGGTPGNVPQISSVASSSVTATSAVITWDTDILSNSIVDYMTATGGDFSGSNAPSRGKATLYTSSHSVSLSGLSPSTTYYYQVRSIEAGGTSASDKDGVNGYTFATTSAPAISSVAVASETNTGATVTWSTNTDSSSELFYSTDAGLANPVQAGTEALVGGSAPFSHSVTIGGLSSGTTYYFYVKSTDASGAFSTDNNSGLYYSFQANDDTNPAISGNDESAITDNEAVIYWLTDEQANSRVDYGTVSGGPYTGSGTVATYDRSHYVILSGLTANTNYYYTVTSADINGNSRASTEYPFTTLRNPEEQHDPLTSITMLYNTGGAAGDPKIITDTKAVIAFNTDQPALCTIEYGTSSGSYAEVPVSETLYNENHSMHLTGLIFSTKYYYRITCEDNLDTVVNSSEYYFTTLETQYDETEVSTDSTAPTISSVGDSGATGESVVIKWTTNEDSSSYVRYGTTTDYGSMAGNDLVNADAAKYVTSHKVTMNSLVPATKYYYTVISIDASGNIAESKENTFTTKSPSGITSVKVESKSLGEAVISWQTAESTTSTVDYGLTTSYSETKENSTRTKEHEISISGLNSGQTYHFRVKGKDAANNLYSSSDYTFDPKSPPKISGIKTELVSEHEVKVIFNTDMPADALVIYSDPKDDKNSGSKGTPEMSTSHEITLSGLKPGTTYEIKIRAKDGEGNEAEESSSDFTTGKDENAPKINQIKMDTALAQGEKVQAIISWTTDEPSIVSLIYKEGQEKQEKEVKINEDYALGHIAVINTFKSGVAYYFKIKASDQFGNVSISSEHAVLTPKRKDNIIQVITNTFQDMFSWARF